MPRTPARIRKRFVEGKTEVLNWMLEEALLLGESFIGPAPELDTVDDWRRAWERWGGIILPKSLEHRPGTRPFALYAIGEIPQREVLVPVPTTSRYRFVDVKHSGGTNVRHYINAPEPYVLCQTTHLYRLGLIDDAERVRYRQWIARTNPECDQCALNTYPLEASLYE